MIDLTTCIAVDLAHIEQLALTVPTWRRHYPELWHRPMLVTYDAEQIGALELGKIGDILKHDGCRFAGWPDRECPPFPSQRFKMISSFIFAPPRYVKTFAYLKLDTDAVALGRDERFLNDEWLAPLEDGSLPPFCGAAWSYTACRYGHPSDFDAWADRHSILSKFPPMNLGGEPNAKRVSHPRVASWCFLGRTEWARWAASLCEYGKPPVYSHDGYLSFLAIRTKTPWRTWRPKRMLWTNCRKIVNLRRIAAEALAANQ